MAKIILRPEVRKFAEQMKLKLRKHDQDRGPRGWLQSDVFWLADRIRTEHRELVNALLKYPQDIQAIFSECADVANFAMMVADVVYRYGVQNMPTPSEKADITVGYHPVENMADLLQFIIALGQGDAIKPEAWTMVEVPVISDGVPFAGKGMIIGVDRAAPGTKDKTVISPVQKLHIVECDICGNPVFHTTENPLDVICFLKCSKCLEIPKTTKSHPGG